MSNYNLKDILPQLNAWCATNGICVKSVYDDSNGMTLQQLVYYLLGVVKQSSEEVVDYESKFEDLYNFVHDYFDNLDVQQEINNKLNEMASDGTLSDLIEPFLSEYAQVVAEVNTKYNNLQTQVNNLVLQAGSPEATSAEIAQARGSYSTLNGRLDVMFESATRLTSPQESPFNDLNTFPCNKCYELYGYAYTNVNNKPTNTGDFATILTFSGYAEYITNYTTAVQFFFSSAGNYVRLKKSNSWNEWRRVDNSEIEEERLFESVTRLTAEQSAPFNDLNTFPCNKCYELYGYAYTNVNNKPTNTGDFATILTFSGYGEYITNYTTAVQFFFANNDTYIRQKYRNTWTEWVKLNIANNQDIVNFTGNISTPQTYSNSIINGNGYAIDLGTKLNGTSAGVQYINFEYTEGDLLDQCFISKTKDLSDSSSTRSAGYYVTLWDDQNNKLVPTLSTNPGNNEFTYDGTKFIINSQQTSFVLNDVNDVRGVTANNCKFYNLKILHACRSCLYVNGSNCSAYGCEFGYSSLSEGVELYNSSGEYVNCLAYYNRNDGFNIHTSTTGASNTSFRNCNGYNNFDDGISHHDNSVFEINGGEYYNNGKGGVSSPTYGATGFISGVYSHDNNYGLYASDNDVSTTQNILVFNSVFEDNAVGIRTDNYNIITHAVSNTGNTTNSTITGEGSITDK